MKKKLAEKLLLRVAETLTERHLKVASNVLFEAPKSTNEAEVVIFFESKVWSQQQLPGGFDLSRSVVVSFERDKVRYFDFRKMAGGYYRRIHE